MYYALKINNLYVASDSEGYYLTDKLVWAKFCTYEEIYRWKSIEVEEQTYTIIPSMIVRVRIEEVK